MRGPFTDTHYTIAQNAEAARLALFPNPELHKPTHRCASMRSEVGAPR
eukprot:SAG11_NODE_26081_length_350_cov_0.617530_1_plen_47_part_10